MAADLATLAVRIDASQAKAELGGLEGALGKVGKVAAALGVTLGAASLLKKFVDETSAAQYAVAQLEARLKSTGGVAGQSLAQLQAFSGEMQRLTTYSDEAVQGAQALLLTFTKIRGDVFPGATKAALNLATAMGTDLRGAAIQIGKALQDPEQGLTALRRSGVSFTESQQNVIKSLFATGQEAKAQKLILAELEVQFGGAAEAARNTFGGALAGLKNAWGELFEVSRSSSIGIIDAINGITKALPVMAGAFGSFVQFVRLTYVDLIEHIQLGNAAMYRDSAKVLGVLSGLAATIPGLSGIAATLAIKSVELTKEADALTAAFTAWAKQERLAIFNGRELVETQNKVRDVLDKGTDTTLRQAIADERAARAKAELNAEAVRQLNIETERAKRANLGPAGVIGQMVKSAATAEAGSVMAAREEIERFGNFAVREDKRTVDEILLYRATQRAKDFEAQLKVGSEAAREEHEIRVNFLRQFQQTFADGIGDMLTKGLNSWRDFFANLKQMFLKLVADFAAAKIMDKMLGTSTAGATSLGSFFGVGKGGAPGAGAGYAGTVLASAGVGYGLGKSIGGAKGVAAGALGGAATGAMIGLVVPVIGPAVGAVVGGIAGFVGGLFGASKAAKEAAARQRELAEQTRLAAEQAAREAEERRRAREEAGRILMEDLAIRRLRAQGLEEEADALALATQQAREFAEAVKAGLSPEVLAELARTQGLETKRREDDLAARRAEEAARRSAEAAGAMPDPSGVVATRQLSTVTSGQGDRMVDELRSSRIHLSNIDRFVRIIADNTGGLRQFSRTVDSALSNALASASAYSGNALVTA